MINDDKLNDYLTAFDVPIPSPDKIEKAIIKAQRSVPMRRSTSAYSLFYQIKVQATYLSKGFYLVSGLLTTLFAVLGAFANDGGSMADVYFCLAPLLIIPCATSIHRTFSSGMFELEGSCKYSFSKIIAGKMLLLGGFSVVGLLISWLLSCMMRNAFDPAPILFALISFSFSCTLILWFGRGNIVKGFIAGGVWTMASTLLKILPQTDKLMSRVNNSLLSLILIVCMSLLVAAATFYLGKLGKEDEFKWKFALTD